MDRILVSFTLFIPFSYRSPWLLSTFTSRKGSFMKVSIILGDRRERSEQREPRMGGNRSERSRVSSGVVDSRPFLRHLRFISLPSIPHPEETGWDVSGKERIRPTTEGDGEKWRRCTDDTAHASVSAAVCKVLGSSSPYVHPFARSLADTVHLRLPHSVVGKALRGRMTVRRRHETDR